MVPRILDVLFFVLFIHQGFCLREIWLEDVNVNIISHPYFGRSIGIPKNFWDLLESCHVIFPDGTEYEAYPEDNIPHDSIFYLHAVQPFTSCAIGFRGVGEEFSGTYQLLSKVLHSSDQSLSLTRQRFNIQISKPETQIMESGIIGKQ